MDASCNIAFWTLAISTVFSRDFFTLSFSRSIIFCVRAASVLSICFSHWVKTSGGTRGNSYCLLQSCNRHTVAIKIMRTDLCHCQFAVKSVVAIIVHKVSAKTAYAYLFTQRDHRPRLNHGDLLLVSEILQVEVEQLP